MSKFFLELPNSAHKITFGVHYKDDELVFNIYFFESEIQDSRTIAVEGIIYKDNKAKTQTFISPMKGYDGNEFSFEFKVNEKRR